MRREIQTRHGGLIAVGRDEAGEPYLDLVDAARGPVRVRLTPLEAMRLGKRLEMVADSDEPDTAGK